MRRDQVLLTAVLAAMLVSCDCFKEYEHNRVPSHNEYEETDKILRGPSYNEQDTLVLTHVIFRHGDRTPDDSTIYPNDPYANETYYPYGKGGLTIEGKKKAYKLGQSLRKRYNVFLSDVYSPDIIESTSSAYPRTQMTLQAVHTALFPPTKDYQIRNDLGWQPIPITYSSYETDKLIATYRSCDPFFDIADGVEQSMFQDTLRKYSRLFEYLSKYSGWVVNNTRLAFFIQNSLKTEEEWGFPLPEWTDKIYPQPLGEVASMFWKISSSTVRLRRIAVGNLLKKIVEDSIRKMKGSLKPMGRKMFLYSGHDFTVVPILAALGHYDGAHLPYTSHIIFELHNIDGIYGFKVYFQDYKQKNPRLLNLKGCGTFCHVHDMVDLLRDHFPGDNWCS